MNIIIPFYYRMTSNDGTQSNLMLVWQVDFTLVLFMSIINKVPNIFMLYAIIH